MKRLLSLLLVIAMLFSVCAMFTACDSGSSSSDKEEEEEEKTNRVKLSMKGVTVEEEVLYDDNGMVLTVTDMKVDGDYVEIYFEVENTTDETLSISCDTAVVNGISSCGYGFYQTVYGGETNTMAMNLYVPLLELLQVKTIGHLDMYISIYNENYDSVALQEKITVNTSEKGFVHTQEFDGTVLYEKKNVRVTLIETSFKKNGESGMFVLIENSNSKHVSLNINQVQINGWLLPYIGCNANLYGKTNTVALLDLSGLEDVGIKKAKDIQNMYFNIWAYDDEYDELFEDLQVPYIPGDEDYVYEKKIDGEVLYEDDDVQIILNSLTAEGGQVVAQLYIKNSSEDLYSLDLYDWKVDGYECYASTYTTLPAGAQCLRTVYLYSDFKVDSLEELDSITATLGVTNNGENYSYETYSISIPLD